MGSREEIIGVGIGCGCSCGCINGRGGSVGGRW